MQCVCLDAFTNSLPKLYKLALTCEVYSFKVHFNQLVFKKYRIM